MDKMNFFTELSEDDKLRQADKEFLYSIIMLNVVAISQ